ncbi:hypothetical protein [Paenibacillus alvei]|uniref:Phage tail protein n=1 Tax=Paenibacillus alvei TaxID=44250 RepID=A0A383RAK7_PAEAL|nr:hypothetical protein [Paenibacillus alvei]SYX83998.1 conserved protein of unknown function [Paenibacillus alvei]
MNFNVDRLYQLLPAIYRIRDIEQGDGIKGGSLRGLLGIIAEEVGILEGNLAQLYDDQFIETCAEWVIPYLGDLLGVRNLQAANRGTISHRAYVANTLAYRRRKGTALMLEQLARDITGWDARVVEFFQLLATSQSLHHIRPTNIAMLNLRQREALEWLNTPFDRIPRTVDVRRISSHRGRYNIPNIGIFLWRLRAYPLTFSPAPVFQGDALRYTFSPLGNNTQLFTHPMTEGEFTELAKPLDVPEPISRHVLNTQLDEYYGKDRSLFLQIDGSDFPAKGQHLSEALNVCNLSDVIDAQGNIIGWAHMPSIGEKIALDPVLGRLAFPPDRRPESVRVTFYSGFSMELGGGEYERISTFDPELQTTALQLVPKTNSTIQDALSTLNGSGTVQILDSGRYSETPIINVAANQRIELRADDGKRPHLLLNNTLQISGDENTEVILNGLLISGGALHVSGKLERLTLRHCTLVPGLTLDNLGEPQQPGEASLIVQTDPEYPISILIDHCIIGPLRMPADGVKLTVKDSIINAPPLPGRRDKTLDKISMHPGVALASDAEGPVPGPATIFERVTVFGKVSVQEIVLASNCLFTEQVTSVRRQTGCMRFSYVPVGSKTPRCYCCQPNLAVQQAIADELKLNPSLSKTEQEQISEQVRDRIKPGFTQKIYGQPAFAQLDWRTPLEIRTGADDGAEMGAFHDVFQAQREANLISHLDEFLKFGMEAGLFYVT